MKSQKEIAGILDMAAARAESINKEPASGKQCWFLAKLLLTDERTVSDMALDTSFVLTKREASQMISALAA